MKVFFKILILSISLYCIAEIIIDFKLGPHYENFETSGFSINRLFKIGDSLKWSKKEYDDSRWVNRKVNFDTTGVFWMRQKMYTNSHKFVRQAIKIDALASYEFFWDGVLIGENGKIGASKNNEIEGRMTRIFIIPDSLSNYGYHTLALRASNFHLNNKIRIHGIIIGPASKVYTTPIIFTIFMHLLGGAFLIISIYYLFQFTYDKSLISFLFGLLCFMFLLLIIFEYVKFYYSYHYSFHFKRLFIIEIITICISLLLPLFLASRFKIPKLRLILSLMLVIICLIEMRVFPGNHDSRIRYLFAFSLIISTIIISWACFKKIKGSGNALASIVPSFLIFYYYDVLLFISFFVFIVYNLLSLSEHQKRINEEKNAALIQSARLELDLIKKSIQPHFLMNTLTSVIEWIEQEPKKSVQFVEALAEEFRLLERVSNKKLVTLKEELELCELHLKIMNMRKGITYSFDYSNVTTEAKIPPGIIHTIIENGVSHSIVKKQLSFVLSESINKERTQYELTTIGEKINVQYIVEGTGTKYIKARLKETYGNKWKFNQQPKGNIWLTEIEIYN
ncbi:hypothetical protein D7030_04865 [Flavobacteriaceae bacterium AU392]|nr:hypothetical protein D1817_11340 [Flavobacteriaceae bacterium]RKM86007.1 hypothetical protein D7030_04865 [Flavobacteriaceae bacterium AU392]